MRVSIHVANQKSRNLGLFDRKLEGAAPFPIVLLFFLINVKELKM